VTVRRVLFGSSWFLQLTVTAFGQTHSCKPESSFIIAGGNYSGPPLKEVMAGPDVRRGSASTASHTKVSHRVLSWRRTDCELIGWGHRMVEPAGRTTFWRRGYIVYLTDQPARGRSPWNDSRNGPLTMPASGQVERQFTAPEILGAGVGPQAKKHTQWPGQGEKKGAAGETPSSTLSIPPRSKA